VASFNLAHPVDLVFVMVFFLFFPCFCFIAL